MFYKHSSSCLLDDLYSRILSIVIIMIVANYIAPYSLERKRLYNVKQSRPSNKTLDMVIMNLYIKADNKAIIPFMLHIVYLVFLKG